MKGRYKRHRRYAWIKICMLMVVLASVGIYAFAIYSAYEDARADEIQQGIADEIIRFHVRANSDSCEDQELKLHVKEAVVEYIRPLLEKSQGIDESRDILTEQIENIRQLALEVISSEGYEYDVDVYFEYAYFPAKIYGDLTFPPGEYEAFRIDIGESIGKNWWCVLYPPLCFVDAVYAEVPENSKQKLKDCLSDEEYDTITSYKIRFRFKYLTWFNRLLTY